MPWRSFGWPAPLEIQKSLHYVVQHVSTATLPRDALALMWR